MSFDMEGIGSEVSQKIRAAIKAKLIELGAYVDDELPDYIMVMVANKRTRSQMDEDLQLFLSSNTKIFTTWLHTVLQKLHEVTVATFEGKKQTEAKKSKEKKPGDEEKTGESRKSSEEGVGKVKKHNKKHKESKKAKKNKHKSKDKVKSRAEKKHKKDESKEKSENEEDKVKSGASQESEGNKSIGKTSKDNTVLDTVVEKGALEALEKSEKQKSNKSDSSSQSSSSTENSVKQKKNETENAVPDSKTEEAILDEGNLSKKFDNEEDEVDGSSKKNKKELIEDEFNIEPLEPKDKPSDKESVKSKESSSLGNKTQTTISAPTEELLKVHDKLQNQKFEKEKKKNKKEDDKSASEDSLSPEEMRKQLLLNRAKKRLEESKLAERMKSNSPDILIEEVIRSGDQNKESRSIPSKQAEPRSARSSPHHSAFLSKDSSRAGSPNHRSRKLSPNSSDYRSQSPGRKNNADYKSKQSLDKGCATEEKRRLTSRDISPARKSRSQEDGREKKKDIIRISESLEMEKKSVSKKDSEKESAARKALSSRVVTITEPEAPEIPSVVKVKPREFVAKDKQANKNLILKAVAEAEKSIATIPPKHKIEPPETKKREGLFTKDLREKRLQNIEVTISKVSNSESVYRRISKDSAGRSDKSRTKNQISEMGESHRKKSDLSCRKTSRSEDQFISSKTSGMEKNDKYIRCWLEGVEKAVKEDVMIDPNKMEDLVHSNFTDEEHELPGEKHSKSEDVRKRKKLKTEDLSEGQSSKNPKKSEKSDGERSPQIVVTMDGLNSKTLKDIITRSKEGVNGPLMLKQKDRKEKSGKVMQRFSELPEEKSPSSSRNLTSEKISDRFGRLNPVNDVKDSERRKALEKTIVYHGSERDKKESNNKELIARLSEKFGKVDREFESKKRKYPEEDRRYQHESGRSQKDEYEKNGKYRKSDRRFPREDADFKDIRVSKSRDRFKF